MTHIFQWALAHRSLQRVPNLLAGTWPVLDLAIYSGSLLELSRSSPNLSPMLAQTHPAHQ